jgi:hypothetical protein
MPIETRRLVRNTGFQSAGAPAPRLGLAIAAADGTDIGPPGHHLRWFTPRSAGYPARGFEIFRIPDDEWRKVLQRGDLTAIADLDGGPAGAHPGVANWSGRERRLSLHPDLDLVWRQETALATEGGSLRLVSPGKAANLLLRFRRPVIHIRLEMSLPAGTAGAKLSVTGWHHSARLGEAPLEEIIALEMPGLTDLLIPLAFERIKRIAFVREVDVIEAVQTKGIGALAHSLQPPPTAAEAYNRLTPDLADGIANRMLKAQTIEQAKSRYPLQEVHRLVQHLNLSIGSPEVTVTAPETTGRASFPVRVLDYLHLAALDPNIARMLASYWVDPTPGAFLYLVCARYGDGQQNLSYGFGFTRHAAPAPEIKKPVSARQLPGIDYRKGRPRGRVALAWPRESGDYRYPAKPVWIDVERFVDGVREPLTPDAPHLIGSRSPHCFRDAPPTGVKVRYRVTPIDILGRLGPAVETEAIEIQDLGAPVPPRKVRAVVEQEGFPWQRPAQRREPDIRRAVLSATAEFGEAQRRASPDARGIRWRWRAGPLSDDARDPASWTLLSAGKLTPPLAAAIVWKPGKPPSAFTLPVAAIRPLERTASRGIGPGTMPDAGTPSPSGSDLLELLLDRPLLEPGVFDGYQIPTPQGPVTVIGTHAGIAAGMDDERLKRAARLVVTSSPAAATLQAGTAITLKNPFQQSASALQALLRATGSNHLEMPTPLVGVVLQKPLGNDQAQAVGGEVAIDYHYLALPATDTQPARIRPVDAATAHPLKRRQTIIGRLVSDVRSGAAESSFILRLKSADFLRVMLIAAINQPITTTARFHPPNLLPRTTIGLNGAAGRIQIAMPPGKRYTTLYLSATTVSAEGRESTRVAAPFELRLVNPPPVITPAAPYPADQDPSAPYGQASPADHQGRASVRVAWQPVSLPGAATDGVRYELARALDASIIASDRDRWRRGDGSAHFAALGIKPGAEVSGRLEAGSIRDPARGTFQVRVQGLDLGTVGDLLQIKGSIRITHSFVHPTAQDRQLTHRLLRAVSAESGVTLLCQPFFEPDEASIGEIKAAAAFTAQATPDYAAVLANENRLRQLADLRHTREDLAGEGCNESAFGVVTGVPVSSSDFVDTIPGIGRSRFFYKVRAVFAGELRSAWSPASVAFRQADLTPADAPEVVRVRRAADAVRIILVRPEGPGVRGIRLLRAAADGTFNEITTFTFSPRDGEKPLAPAALHPAGRLVDLRRVLQEVRASYGAAPELTGIYDAAVDRAAPPADGNLMTDGTRVVGGIVELPSAPPAERPLAVRAQVGSEGVWLTQIAAWVEIGVPAEAAAQGELFAQTVKEIDYRGTTVLLNSEHIRIGGAG